MDKKEIINSIKELCNKNTIQIDTPTIFTSNYPIINEYIDLLKYKVKPESAAALLIRKIIEDILDKNRRNEDKVRTEVNFEGSFIDIVINEEGSNNPVCIELKPLYKFYPNRNILQKVSFNYKPHQPQIQKYLRHRSVEYVILTNIDKVFIFNRNALIEFEPIAETTFCEILEDYLIYESFWDTIRRFEDNIYQMELGKEFFEDLKKWYKEFDYIIFKKDNGYSREEMIVQFLNKFIFIKTLEDYGLIPYHFIKDEYESYLKKWIAKGNYQIFRHFFDEIEDFFDMYYDTELFTSNFFDFIDYEKQNLNQFKYTFEEILGLDAWSLSFGKGLVHYNYRKIDEDIFGKAYETWIAENKKDEGIYYTHSLITTYMAQKIVDSLFDEKINSLLEELKKPSPDADILYKILGRIREIKIIDSTSGSGSFIIKVLRYIYDKYKLIDSATEWSHTFFESNIFQIPDHIKVVQDFRINAFLDNGLELKLISSIILNHIYLADKDERAIDTAKTNIWKEAVKLNPRIYNYRRLDNNKMHILPNLSLNFITGDSLTDFDFSEQISIIAEKHKEDIIRLFQIRNEYISNPYNPSILDESKKIKANIRNTLREHHKLFDDTLFFPLEFFFCYFDDNGSPLKEEEQGFDGIISNPPWEAIKPIKKEFAELGKYEMDILNFNKWFDDKLNSDLDFANEWANYVANYDQYTNYLYSKYKYQGAADPNYYKFFIERDFQLLKRNSYFALLVPSGFQTDEGASLLRKLIIEENKLIELASFENRGFTEENKDAKTILFPEVDNRFKFSIILANKTKQSEDYKFKTKFYLHHPEDLYNENFIIYNIEKIKRFSPENHSIMEFRSEKDFEICSKILDEKNLLKTLALKLRREFDMTNDSNLFISSRQHHKGNNPNELRLYEGKMIHQFTSSFGVPRYYINEKDAREILLRKVLHRIKSDNKFEKEDFEKLTIPNDLLLDYQTYRLVYRAVGSSTNERSLISTIVPKNVFIGHSMNHIVNVGYTIDNNEIIYKTIEYLNLIYLMAILNSLTLNYYIRNKISANLTMNFIYELPIAEAKDEQLQKIIELSANLLYKKSNKSEYEELIKDLNIKIDKNVDEIIQRAVLEIIIAKYLYGLDKAEWDYLASTFTYGEGSSTKAELNEIIKKSDELWDNI